METNPYKPPRSNDLPRSNWRLLWKRVCLACLGMAVIFHLIGAIVANSAKGSIEDYRSTILLGLLALGELVSWTMFGVGGIGWIICRRTRSGGSPGQQSRPDA